MAFRFRLEHVESELLRIIAVNIVHIRELKHETPN